MASITTKFKNLFAPAKIESASETHFLDLAPTDKADKIGVYSEALTYAVNNPKVSNIALTGPYGSGKSSIIKSFLKKYERNYLQISLAAFLPEVDAKDRVSSRQEIERSILQQMLYGADANRLPLSRFKRIQSPKWWSKFVPLQIIFSVFSCWYIFSAHDKILNGEYFLPFDITNWFNYTCFGAGLAFLWQLLHHIYWKSFGVSLKSISLKDIEIEPIAADQESILNRHLDEIIYFFQSTKYDLVIIEDLDRFKNPDIFVTLREINSIINANAGVKRPIRFLYALRDNMFVNTDRTKFFEFIIPVIPIISTSNSIDKVLEQGQRLSLDERLDPQFLREVSRYLDDLRLIQNIFNEYAIYIKNLETDGESVLDANKLLAVLIYKNVFPSDFEKLHQGKGIFAEILDRRDDYIANNEAEYKSQIAALEKQISDGEKQVLFDVEELCKVYTMALIEKLPDGVSQIRLNQQQGLISIRSLSKHDQFEQIINAPNILARQSNGRERNVALSGLQSEVHQSKNFQQRKKEIEQHSSENRNSVFIAITGLRAQIADQRAAKFSKIIRQNADGVEEQFEKFGDKKELARFLVFEGYLDDTYYQYTSLFHSGRLSPNDNKFLIQIRSFINPEPDFKIDNAKEVIAAMRDEDFDQSYVLNIHIVDAIFEEDAPQRSNLFKFIRSNFRRCQEFFSSYYATGKKVSALLSDFADFWPEYAEEIVTLADRSMRLAHIAKILEHMPADKLEKLNEEQPKFSEFIATDLSEVLALENNFDLERLKLLQLEIVDLSSITTYPNVLVLLAEEGLYQLSTENIEVAYSTLLSSPDVAGLRKQHYSTILRADNDALSSKILNNFSSYVENILLRLQENSEEDVSAITLVINHEKVGIETAKEFLKKQTAVLPALDKTPSHLHALLFQIEKIQASWANCLAFISSESYDAEILTSYLNKDETRNFLSKTKLSDSNPFRALRKFLIENEDLNDMAYKAYISMLPQQFIEFPENLSSAKLKILIEERKITFSAKNLASLSEDSDLEVLFAAKNIESYLKKQSKFNSDDDFRELLLLSDIEDKYKLKIIDLMNLNLLSNLPLRAATIGEIIERTGSDLNGLEADIAIAIIVNSKPASVQISLFNKFQKILDDEQVRATIQSLPEPYSEVTTGYQKPKIKKNSENLEFVKWLDARDIISSWSETILFDDIRINLFRS